MISDIRLRDLPTFIRTTDADDTMLTINIKRCELDAPAADGILLNTFDDLERVALDAIRGRLPNTFTIGPLGPEVTPPSYLPSLTSSLWKEDDRCVAWLDAQPAVGSVVYVNFGSITVVTREQMVEFARGLAAAGSPFLWVVRPDMVRDGVDMLPVPEGFAEEVAGRGLMVGWCDQEAVLGHRATGGFLSHCGWNSTVESLSHGKPILAWPMHCDQPWDAELVCNYLKAGILVRPWEKHGQVIAAKAIQEVIEEAMISDKGMAMQRRAMLVGDAVRASVADGGSSRKDLEDFIAYITR
jgi:UDP:flavonoid glycosyltransferase YjiC (YdhE family)